MYGNSRGNHNMTTFVFKSYFKNQIFYKASEKFILLLLETNIVQQFCPYLDDL